MSDLLDVLKDISKSLKQLVKIGAEQLKMDKEDRVRVKQTFKKNESFIDMMKNDLITMGLKEPVDLEPIEDIEDDITDD